MEVSRGDTTPFMCQSLLQACKAIPKGKCSTYGALAAVLGSSARAVGQVCNHFIHSVVWHACECACVDGCDDARPVYVL